MHARRRERYTSCAAQCVGGSSMILSEAAEDRQWNLCADLTVVSTYKYGRRYPCIQAGHSWRPKPRCYSLVLKEHRTGHAHRVNGQFKVPVQKPRKKVRPHAPRPGSEGCQTRSIPLPARIAAALVCASYRRIWCVRGEEGGALGWNGHVECPTNRGVRHPCRTIPLFRSVRQGRFRMR